VDKIAEALADEIAYATNPRHNLGGCNGEEIHYYDVPQRQDRKGRDKGLRQVASGDYREGNLQAQTSEKGQVSDDHIRGEKQRKERSKRIGHRPETELPSSGNLRAG
jgi:hypothetical protein